MSLICAVPSYAELSAATGQDVIVIGGGHAPRACAWTRSLPVRRGNSRLLPRPAERRRPEPRCATAPTSAASATSWCGCAWCASWPTTAPRATRPRPRPTSTRSSWRRSVADSRRHRAGRAAPASPARHPGAARPRRLGCPALPPLAGSRARRLRRRRRLLRRLRLPDHRPARPRARGDRPGQPAGVLRRPRPAAAARRAPRARRLAWWSWCVFMPPVVWREQRRARSARLRSTP